MISRCLSAPRGRIRLARRADSPDDPRPRRPPAARRPLDAPGAAAGWLLRLAWLSALFLAFAPPSPATAATSGWRLGLERVDLPGPAPRTVGLRVPPSEVPLMLTFEWGATRRTPGSAAWTLDVADGHGWRRIARGQARALRLEAVVLEASTSERVVRLRFHDRRVEGVEELGLYRLDPEGERDVWLFVGASNQWRGITQGRFRGAAAARFGREPVVLNRAEGAWSAARLRRALPGILEAHPEARYVGIHVGGNDVSAHRPWPGGADRLRRDLEAIVGMVEAAGMVPILARLSYRRYRRSPAVPPDANGATPYVEHVYDPVIAACCARFDVDMHDLYRDRPELLSADGIHPTPEGELAWVEAWIEGAARVIYEGAGAP